MAYLTGTNKMSGLVVDAALNMGAHDITLGVGQSVDGKDVSELADGFENIELKDLYNHLTEAIFRTNPGTAINVFSNPERLNDDLTALTAFGDAIAEGVEVNLGGYYYVSHFRQFGDAANNADGHWKIQYLDKNAVWTDWVTGIATSGVSAWDASWTAIATPRIIEKIRFLITGVDSGSAGNSLCRELQMKGE